jgi:hypothetical protein
MQSANVSLHPLTVHVYYRLGARVVLTAFGDRRVVARRWGLLVLSVYSPPLPLVGFPYGRKGWGQVTLCDSAIGINNRLNLLVSVGLDFESFGRD